MLTITAGGRGGQFCDGINRREFLKIGGLALGGMTMADILAAEARAGTRNSHKAVIMIFLCGGPPHQDMWDLKPDAPSEIRGEFKPIGTNVDGIQVTEHMPRLAKMMDKFTIIRSLVGARDEHASQICNHGFTLAELRNNPVPALGSVVARLKGPVDPTVPPFVGLSVKMGHSPWAHPGDGGFLGLPYNPFQPNGPVMEDMTLKGVSLERLRDRRRLLAAVDRFKRESEPVLEGVGEVQQQVFDMLTSRKLQEALDVEREPQKIRELYGRGSPKNVDDGGPCWNDQVVVARRLVEAGVRCVTLGYGRWDYHGNNFGQLKTHLPTLDQAVTGLVTDLHDRGMDKDVSVIVWGEFGRTPRINKDAGRDHWPPVGAALLACGGMKNGQVIGSTTPDGGYADERPLHFRDVFATLYHNLGIDIASTEVIDSVGRPHYLMPGHEPIRELVG
ncbi:MAG: DUF1501 domain-containing protein [Armatimonadota bacterium]